jgi:hypothetical protein
MTKDLGVWTADDCALVLIDYQPEQFESIRSETPADLIELNTRWLARAAKAFDVPIVLSTVGVASGRLVAPLRRGDARDEPGGSTRRRGSTGAAARGRRGARGDGFSDRLTRFGKATSDRGQSRISVPRRKAATRRGCP